MGTLQALFVTPDDTLWVLDTGRPTINASEAPSMPYAVPGGPKLVSINLSNDSISRTHGRELETFDATSNYQGIPFYYRSLGMPVGYQQEGLDGAELSQYGDVMYYSPLTSNYLYSIETSYLRDSPSNGSLATIRAFNNVKNLGQRGGDANGFSGDSLGNDAGWGE
ncbi:hypothetical protein M7I_0111 [Glarea lozoyensis 74030]|uniref:Major royal jelly protein n=1 Tax=Glarea lozoyensis (strain ATCC 74030 / MF5533) TaxID=1104152 RepID=H0ECH3_GLAL7|nr:hypothetical protein M7I_0111 [Glarea lozoyensis 74030]